MVEDRCIYCKRVKALNKEHAFPKALLHKCAALNECAPEWIIKKLCVECNGKLGKLDDILVTKGPMAFVWKIIKAELNPENRSSDSDSVFYNAGTYGINPVNLFYPDSLYGNLIILHEEVGTKAAGFYPTLLGQARVPQMVLIHYPEGQTAEQVVQENCEKWTSGEISESNHDEYDDVYSIFGNTYVFGPKATEYFVAGIEREQEFVSKFVKKHEHLRYALAALFPDNPKDAGKLSGFCKRLNAKTEIQIEASQFEPKDPTSNFVMATADKNAIPYIDRAIAKVAFHCFLYWHPEFSGQERIFKEIRTFVLKNGNHQTSNGEDFVTDLYVPKSYFWSSDKHFHIFRFYENGDNIICQIVFFTGLSLDSLRREAPEPLASEIILAGHSETARRGSAEVKRLPFYVHEKSQLKRKIPVKL
ncbi:MAG: hypothetical protein OXP71_17990 [Candidatus Poribacteria bacterium]|nr:hypothetical protein [Candidatus Poribacteria bacterium]